MPVHMHAMRMQVCAPALKKSVGMRFVWVFAVAVSLLTGCSTMEPPDIPGYTVVGWTHPKRGDLVWFGGTNVLVWNIDDPQASCWTVTRNP